VLFVNIDKGENGFREGDLHPYCFNTTGGKVVASPLTRFMGTDIRAFKDPTGNAFGKGLYAAAQKREGQNHSGWSLHVSKGRNNRAVVSESELR
jgi:hypothetical protein